MTDERDVLTRVLAYHDHIAVPPVPVADDVRRGRRRVRRHRALVTGGAAIGVACVVVVVSLLTGGVGDPRPQPAVPTPSPSATAPANGAVTGAAQHFGAAVTDYQWRDFEPGSDTGLYVVPPSCGGSCSEHTAGFTVVGRKGPVAALACGPRLACRQEETWRSAAAALGPGPDEVTVELTDRTLQVLGYDGKARRTVDLAGRLVRGEDVRRLAWSHASRVLAVLTHQQTGGTGVSRVWLVDEAGRARLGYSAPGSAGVVATLGGWSPDGRVLLLDQRDGDSTYGARVVALRLQPAGATRPAMARTLYRSDRHFDWAGSIAWSPDGTRVAVRTRDHVVEVSPADGRVLADRPPLDGWLVWPRANG